ncbi:MAG: ABC transporter permease [Cyclobacteriaceae bacterium]
MFRNYIKIGYRSIKNDWKFSSLNIIGLSMGLAVFVSILLLVNHEMTFDRFHTKGDRIFQVIQHFTNPDGDDPEIWTSLNLSDALREEIPMVENAVTVHSASPTWFEIDGNRFFEEDGIVAGPQFFDLFDFQLLQGDRKFALADKSRSIVISERMSVKLFGLKDGVLGKIISIERYGDFTVSGVLANIPPNSFIQFDYIITQNYDMFFEHVAPWFPNYFNSWSGYPAGTFVLLKEPELAERFQEQANKVLERHINDEADINPHYLINLYDLHFGLVGVDGRINEYIKGDLKQVKIIAVIAFLILLMACFNYINIATSRSIRRFKEVGVRKSIGASKGQLMKQFLIEALLVVFISFLLSCLWIFIFLPYLKIITGINLEFTLEVLVRIAPFVVATLLFVTFLAGFYPTIYLTRFSAIRILKNMTISVKGSATLRNGLVIMQYCLVLFMLSALFIVNRQYSFFSNKNLGFDTEELVIVEVNGGGVRQNFKTIKQLLLDHPQIESVTGLTRMISGYRSSVAINAIDKKDPDLIHPMRFYGMDKDGLETLGLELKSGNFFQGIKGLDSTTVFLNEQAALLYGGTEILGEPIYLQDDEGGFEFRGTVGGIIKDFHYSSLHEPIGPVIIGYLSNPFQGLDDIVIKVQDENISETMSYIEKVHNQFDENDVMTWEFLDDMVQRSYEREATFQKVFTIASIITLIISLLGVVGITAYNVVAKTKEIGIRKVFGASFSQILTLQGKSLFRFLVFASLITIPLVALLGEQWLNNYAYRVNITVWPFLLVIFFVFLLTTVIVLALNFQIAKANPVKSIRYE